MLYIALIPAIVWVVLLLVTWGMLANHMHRYVGRQGPVSLVWLAVLALQAIAASAAAISTDIYPIDSFACALGYFGSWISWALTGAAGVVLLILRKGASQHKAQEQGGFRFAAAIWLILSTVAILAHMRSAGLCTV